jgi:hypothetical protein
LPWRHGNVVLVGQATAATAKIKSTVIACTTTAATNADGANTGHAKWNSPTMTPCGRELHLTGLSDLPSGSHYQTVCNTSHDQST